MAAPLFGISGASADVLKSLRLLLSTSEIGLEGVTELEFILEALKSTPLKSSEVGISVTLARGLNYYTGTIMEVSAPKEADIGSIGGGGRYDDLTSIFGLKDIGGVGISFGLDRIYLVLEALNLFPKTILSGPRLFFVNFGEQESLSAMKMVYELRQKGVSCELYPSAAKMQKQMKYAHSKDAAFVALVGETELLNCQVVIKNMNTGDQKTYPLAVTEELLAMIK